MGCLGPSIDDVTFGHAKDGDSKSGTNTRLSELFSENIIAKVLRTATEQLDQNVS